MPPLLTGKEVAATLRISKRTLARYLRDKKLSYLLIGGKILVRQSALDSFIAAREVGGVA